MTRTVGRIWTIGWALAALAIVVALAGCQAPLGPAPLEPPCWHFVTPEGGSGCVQP